VVECGNYTTFSIDKQKLKFVPSVALMGVKAKYDSTMEHIVGLLKQQASNQHFQVEEEFQGVIPNHLYNAILENRLNLVSGRFVGTKSPSDDAILVEDLMSDAPLDLDAQAYGIWIPEEQLLSRLKYQWFAYLTGVEILNSANNIAIAGHIAKSLMESSPKQYVQEKSSLVISPLTI